MILLEMSQDTNGRVVDSTVFNKLASKPIVPKLWFVNTLGICEMFRGVLWKIHVVRDRFVRVNFTVILIQITVICMELM
jgi:hypothetical protein